MEEQIITPQNNNIPDNTAAPGAPAPVSTPPEPPRPSVVEHKKSGKSKALLYILLALLVAAGAFVGAYFWQQSKNDATSAKLTNSETKVAQLQKQLSEAKKTPETTSKAATTTTTPSTTAATDPNLIPGAVDTMRSDGTIHVTPIFKYTTGLTAVWVEYGTTPDSLKQSTEKLTKGIGGGTANTYSTGFTAVIKETDVKAGTDYYYRVAATVDGQTKYSGVAGFTTSK